jgi:hypothetical protein
MTPVMYNVVGRKMEKGKPLAFNIGYEVPFQHIVIEFEIIYSDIYKNNRYRAVFKKGYADPTIFNISLEDY